MTLKDIILKNYDFNFFLVNEIKCQINFLIHQSYENIVIEWFIMDFICFKGIESIEKSRGFPKANFFKKTRLKS